MLALSQRHVLSAWKPSHLDRVIRGKVSMASIKALRQQTGAPIKSVKNALEESEGDLEKALENLRKLGATLVSKRSGRTANEGVISLSLNDDQTMGAMVELSCETDFVARTEQFQVMAYDLAQYALESQSDDVKGTMAANEEKFYSITTSLGEKIELRRIALVHGVQSSTIHKYMHRPASEHCGKIGVLVALNSENNVDDVGSRIAMHIAAAHPKYLSVDAIPPQDFENERNILLELSKQQTGNESKPEHVLQRIVDGRLRKWYNDVVLEQQEMLAEPTGYSGKARSVTKSLAASDPDAAIVHFVRFEAGNL